MASVREMSQTMSSSQGNSPSVPQLGTPPSPQAMMAMLRAGVPPPHAANLMSHCYQMAEKWWGVGLLSPPPPPGSQDTSSSQQSSEHSPVSQGKDLCLKTLKPEKSRGTQGRFHKQVQALCRTTIFTLKSINILS